tara:strand:+ start:69 stop:272 length:204 start_codon:yes stop_codon:yes gene_type:complete
MLRNKGLILLVEKSFSRIKSKKKTKIDGANWLELTSIVAGVISRVNKNKNVNNCIDLLKSFENKTLR